MDLEQALEVIGEQWNGGLVILTQSGPVLVLDHMNPDDLQDLVPDTLERKIIAIRLMHAGRVLGGI